VPAGRVSPGPMASAMSSRSRPAGHFGVFPVNAMAGTGGSDGGVQLADKLKIIKTDNFDPDAYVQSKCRAMDEKVRNPSALRFRLQC
jgi:exocyst complex component 8